MAYAAPYSMLTLDLARALFDAPENEAAKTFLARVLAETGADRGFVVIQDAGQFVPVVSVRIEADGVSEGAQFSRALVRRALQERRVLHSQNPAEDPQLSQTESVMASRGRAVLVVPLSGKLELYGAIYLEHPDPLGFDERCKTALGEVAGVVGAALQRALLRAKAEQRSREVLARPGFDEIVTRDPAMLDLLAMVIEVADSSAAILITGESGSGKELIARALHTHSSRKSKPFVALHCAALPASLLESELFGHVKGAFSGADRDRAGRIAAAHQGTLFLDELAELPLDVQAKLLRALQFGELMRVGSDRVEKVDVRVVSATHKDLRAEVARGRFREDLYYRVRVVELSLPPLRARLADIELLAEHFRKRHERGRDKAFARDTLALLRRYAFPGNIRELAHAVERACLLSRGPEILPAALPPEIQGEHAHSERAAASIVDPTGRASGLDADFGEFTKVDLERAQDAALAAVERRFLEGLMQRSGGNVSRASRDSGIHRSHLHKLLARHRLDPGS